MHIRNRARVRRYSKRLLQYVADEEDDDAEGEVEGEVEDDEDDA